jgi:hypothetical protein
MDSIVRMGGLVAAYIPMLGWLFVPTGLACAGLAGWFAANRRYMPMLVATIASQTLVPISHLLDWEAVPGAIAGEPGPNQSFDVAAWFWLWMIPCGLVAASVSAWTTQRRGLAVFFVVALVAPIVIWAVMLLLLRSSGGFYMG